MCLANAHNTHYRVAWPSIPLLAEQVMCSVAQVKRDLDYLGKHATVWTIPGRGRGVHSVYGFYSLDGAPLDKGAPVISFSGQNGSPATPFSPAKNSSKRAHPEQENGSKRVHPGQRIKEEKENKTEKENGEASIASATRDARAREWGTGDLMDYKRLRLAFNQLSVGQPGTRSYEGDDILERMWRAAAKQAGVPWSHAVALLGRAEERDFAAYLREVQEARARERVAEEAALTRPIYTVITWS